MSISNIEGAPKLPRIPRKFLLNTKIAIATFIFCWLPRDVAFVFFLFWKLVLKRDGLDGHFNAHLARRITRQLAWLSQSPARRWFVTEFLFMLGAARAHVELFEQFDSLDFDNLRPQILAMYKESARCIFEYRQFEREQLYLLAHPESARGLDDADVVEYCRRFFFWKDFDKVVARDLAASTPPDAISPRQSYINDSRLYYAYRHLILRTYHVGDGHLVPGLHEKTVQVQERMRRHVSPVSKGLARILDANQIKLDDLRLLSPDWAALIGHMGHLDVHLRMRDMGWWSGSPLLATYEGKIANREFLSLLSSRCPTVILDETLDASIWIELCGLMRQCGVSHQAWSGPRHAASYWNDAGSLALQEWEAKGGGYPLRDEYDRRLATNGRAEEEFAVMRAHYGMSESDWHVCLHMRDAATREETEGVGETVRNTPLENYLDAVRHITEQGGWVIRMGGPGVAPLPPLPRVIDYARSPFRSALLDLHLVRKARSFIGTTSGFAYVASSFGIPSALVNGISSIGLLWTKNSRFILKPITHVKEGRLLSQREITSEQWRWTFPTYESLHRAGLRLGENSPDEILEAVKEVNLIAQGVTPPQDSELVTAWRQSLTYPGFYGGSQPAQYFLQKHRASFLAHRGESADRRVAIVNE